MALALSSRRRLTVRSVAVRRNGNAGRMVLPASRGECVMNPHKLLPRIMVILTIKVNITIRRR